MEAFLTSIGIVAVSEIGDKTQLLALMLAARFKRPTPIILGIFTATIFNHAIAGAVGSWVAASVPTQILQWVLGGLFIAMGLWALKPDQLDEDEMKDAATTWGIFVATTIAFFLAEIGDKTQIATAALAARFGSLLPVVAGTTLGMLLTDAPTVYFGRFAAKAAQAAWVRYVAAILFIAMGVATLFASPTPQ